MTTTALYKAPSNGAPAPAAKVHVRVSSSGVHRLVAGLQLAVEVFWLIVQTVVLVVMGVYNFFFPGEGVPIAGKTVLITGAGHGLGRELAIQFSRQGCTIICVDINKEGNDNTVKDIQNEADSHSRGKSSSSSSSSSDGKPKAYGYLCNVARRQDVIELAKRVEAEVGQIDILVNNAGILTEHSLYDATPEEIQNTIDVNFTSHFWTMQAFVPSMWRRNEGHVVAIASVGSFVGVGNFSTYCATKFAVLGLMNSLHEEFRAKKKNIKLTTVHPYFINTRPDLIKGWHHRLPLITPDRVATAVVRAVKRENDSVTIPKYLYVLCVLSRLVPQKVVDIWRDVFYTTITPPNKLPEGESTKSD